LFSKCDHNSQHLSLKTTDWQEKLVQPLRNKKTPNRLIDAEEQSQQDSSMSEGLASIRLLDATKKKKQKIGVADAPKTRL